MDKESPRLVRPFYVSVIKGLIVAAYALILKSVVSFSTWMRYARDSAFGSYENYAIYIICFICSLFIYNSSVGISMTYDVYLRDELMERTYDRKGRMPSFKNIFCYKSYLVETVTFVSIITIAALAGYCPEIFGMFWFDEGKSPYSGGILPALVVLPIVIFLSLLARFEAVRYWKHLYKTANLEVVESKTRFILKLLFVTVLYPIALPYMPIILFVLVTIGAAIAKVAITMTIPVFILVILLGLAALWWLFVLIAMRKRQKFVNKMKIAASKMKFTVSDIKNQNLSLISKKKKCTFSLTRENEKYDCLMIGNPRYVVPVCFISSTRGYYRHRLGFPRHNITLESKFDYSLDTENRKILIISPTPKHAFICEDGKEKRLFTADKLWDFVVYESDGFVGSLERDCLGRYDSNRD